MLCYYTSNTLGSRCAHAHYAPTRRDFWLSRAKEKKKNPESCENPRLLFHGPMPTTSLSSTTRRVLVLETPLRFRLICWTRLFPRVQKYAGGSRALWNPICSRCLCGSAVDWLNASFKNPHRLFKFKKTPGPFAVSPLTFAGELNVYFFCHRRSARSCRLRTMFSVFV